MPKATGDKVEGKGSSLEGEVPLAKPEGRSLTPKTCLLGPKTGLLGVTVALFDPPRLLLCHSTRLCVTMLFLRHPHPGVELHAGRA